MRNVFLGDNQPAGCTHVIQKGFRQPPEWQFCHHPQARALRQWQVAHSPEKHPGKGTAYQKRRTLTVQHAAPRCETGHYRITLLGKAESQVDRSRVGRRAHYDLGHIIPERWHHHRHATKRQQGAVVLECVVGRPHHPVPVPTAVPDQADRQMVEADVIPDLLERTRIDEWRNAICPGAQSGTCQPSRHGHHLLFGNTHIDEAVTERLTHRLECLIAKVTRQEHRRRFGRTGRNNRRTEPVPHCAIPSRASLHAASRASTSAMACAYWASESGR